ncbi:MAG: CTP synthase [Puniceicoccales bacterium]|jgi:CTP synthase|nr:CTP synthase [Puniceicoccales bacterium]
MRYIFISGGVVSSLGKGLTAASVGALLEAWGLRVALKKFDPYLNVDPGTMSPFQHGEVYVLSDGSETDLDLGHYERFTNAKLTKGCSVSSGKIYETILRREREGDYLGETVQVIPHVTDEIKRRMEVREEEADVAIIELGGTVGDIESMPFLEAMRQFILDRGRGNALYGHVVLLPYLRVAEEIKTKPAQQSVALLRGMGIQPDLLFCRTEKPFGPEIRAKLGHFCNVRPEGVIQERDVESIYRVPAMLHDEGVDRFILKYFEMERDRCDFSPWEEIVGRLERPGRELRIAFVGKYVNLQDAYKSVYEALTHGALANGCRLEICRMDPDALLGEDLDKVFTDCGGILVPGGFGNRGIDGKLAAIRHSRERRIPFLGICLGMQLAAVEFARSVAGLANAHSTEFDEGTSHPIITLMEQQRTFIAKGGTMRLGAYDCDVREGTRLYGAYGQPRIRERHRHRYEFNSSYCKILEKKGLVFSGHGPGGLVEAIELANHPWFVGVQFHPEFQSKPLQPHPLFRDFIGAAQNEVR